MWEHPNTHDVWGSMSNAMFASAESTKTPSTTASPSDWCVSSSVHDSGSTSAVSFFKSRRSLEWERFSWELQSFHKPSSCSLQVSCWSLGSVSSCCNARLRLVFSVHVTFCLGMRVLRGLTGCIHAQKICALPKFAYGVGKRVAFDYCGTRP